MYDYQTVMFQDIEDYIREEYGENAEIRIRFPQRDALEEELNEPCGLRTP